MNSLRNLAKHAPRAVNGRWRFFAFTLTALLLLPSLAQADRVVLFPLGGRAEQERLEEIETAISTILRDQGHTVVAPTTTNVPNSSAQMESAASTGNAAYVITAEVDPLRGQYRLHITVYYRPNGRNEELVATVLESEERERLSDILSSMVRREGLGEDALRLTGESEGTGPIPVVPAESEEERRRREAEEQAQREAEEQARREAEEEAQRAAEQAAAERRERESDAQRAWNERPQYGADGHWLLQLGAGGRYAAALGALPDPRVQTGGGLFDVAFRVGRTFDGIDGFELRGGIDFTTGALMGLGIHAGAAWLGSFFLEPFYIGVGGEIGVIFTFTGARDVGFSGRVGAIFAWRPIEHFVIEASVPEIGILSPGLGAVTIGATVRAGYRFD